jgi:hypothetical protein
MEREMMRKLFVIVVVLLLAVVASAYAANEVKPDDSLVINIYDVHSYPSLEQSSRHLDPTVAKVYSDGRLVWSKNGIKGGEPLFKGQVDPKLIGKLMSELDKQGAFEDKTLKRAWVGPDAASTIIEIKDGKKTLKMQSWHELYETNSKLIVTAAGIGTLGNRSREEVMKAQPEDYKHFLAVWDLIRKTVESWPKPKTP